MKHCLNCSAEYTSSLNKCPACQSVKSENKCDKCGTFHKAPVCPKCGRDTNEKGALEKSGNIIKKYPLAFLAVIGMIVLAIIGLSVIAGAVNELHSTGKDGLKNIETAIIVEYDKNLLFNKYEVRVSVDNSVIGTITQGEKRLFNIVLTEEAHTISFSEIGNDKNLSSAEFYISEDGFPYFSIKAKRGGIKINNTDTMTFKEAYSYFGK